MIPCMVVTCPKSRATPTMPRMKMKQRSWLPRSLVVVCGVTVTLLLIGCSRVPGSNAAPTMPSIFALLADNRLLVIRPRLGTVIEEHVLAAPPSPAFLISTGHYLSTSMDGTTLYALVTGNEQTPDGITVIQTGTRKMLARYPLTGSGVYHSLAVGPSTGRLYLFGTRLGATVVTVLDPKTGAVREEWTARPADGHTWLVYQGAVSPDERQLFISYHGINTSGIDWFTRTDAGLQRCSSPPTAQPGQACLTAHGGFVLDQATLLVATGTSVVLRITTTDMVLGGWDTQLVGNHVMDFAVDPAARMLYAVGSCGYQPGFSAVRLADARVPTPSGAGEWSWSRTPIPPQVLIVVPPQEGPLHGLLCGERLAVSREGIIVASLPQPVPRLGTPGAVLVVDPTSGQVLRSIATSSEPLDVLPMPPAPSAARVHSHDTVPTFSTCDLWHRIPRCRS